MVLLPKLISLSQTKYNISALLIEPKGLADYSFSLTENESATVFNSNKCLLFSYQKCRTFLSSSSLVIGIFFSNFV